MDYSVNNVRISLIARQVSSSVGRESGYEYFTKLLDALCDNLNLACGCIYSIDETDDHWDLIAISKDHESCLSSSPELESRIKQQVLSKRQRLFINIEHDTEIQNNENPIKLKSLISFFLYDSYDKINGVIIFGDRQSAADQNMVIEVIDTQLPRAELALENLHNIRELKSYTNNYNKLVNSSLDVIWEADISGKIRAINASCKAIYGYSEEEMIGKNYRDFMSDKSARIFSENLLTLSRGQTVYNMVSDHITNDQSHIKVSYNIIPKYNNERFVTGVIGTTRDISTSIKAQKTIKNTSELFSSILSRLPVIFFRIDDNGYFVEIRGNGLKRMGVEDMDWVGNPGYGLFIGMDAEIDSALSGNTVFFENKGTFEGTPWWFYTSMFYDSWSGNGAVGFSVDITEQKYVEEQLVVLLNNNRKLSQQLVEVQEDERRNLARELHDELGQSITAVRSLATVITSTTDNQNAEIRNLANSIIELSGQLYEVVNNIMQRLRPDIIDNLNFNETLKNCIVRSQLETAGVNCTLDITGNINDLEEVVKVTIYRIVQECLTNISKHAMASNVTVNIQRGIEDSNLRRSKITDTLQRIGTNKQSIYRDTIRIEVSDDGIGLDVDKTVRNGKQGIRHGLQGIEERVTAMGGRLQIIGQPGKGTDVLAILVLGSNNHDVSHDINKCISDLRKMRLSKSKQKLTNSH